VVLVGRGPNDLNHELFCDAVDDVVTHVSRNSGSGAAGQGAGRIDVSFVVLANVPSACWPGLAMLLSDEERNRVARLRFRCHRQEYIAAHALKRVMLCEMIGARPQELSFATEPFGKPFLTGRGPHFNLSHCDGLVACASSWDFPVGIDVESVQRRAPLHVARKYFSPDEQAWLSALPESERGRGFFRLWTVKEAVVKATGRGLAQDLRAFEVLLDPVRINANSDRTEAGEWRAFQVLLRAAHMLGLAWRGPGSFVNVCEVEFRRSAGGWACRRRQATGAGRGAREKTVE
jgi:4'-phosphopantetheinyl transferase